MAGRSSPSRRAGPSALRALWTGRFGATEAHGEGDRAFLQERLRLLCAIAGGLSLLFLLVVGVVGLVLEALGPPQVAGVALVAAAYLVALPLLRRPLPAGALALLDTAVTTLAVAGCAVHGWVGPLAPAARHDMLLAANNIVLARAILLPATARSTALVSALAYVPMLGPSVLRALGLASLPGPVDAAFELSQLASWALVAVVLAALVSRTIYRLRREARVARRLGVYELGERIGAGAMGEVFRASHGLLRRPTAVKLLRPDRAGEEAIARFEQEVRLCASLTHPNTVAVYDFGRTADRVFYCAMELLDGRDLQAVVDDEGPLPPRRVVHVLQQVCGSLAEAHDCGVVHRDVKAGNVMLCRRAGAHDVVKVVDFGLAQLRRTEGEGDGIIAGTPSYLAPELWRGAAAQPASDLYAVGVLAHRLLTGALPFPEEDLMPLCAAHVLRSPPSLRAGGAEVPEGLEEAVRACLAKDPAERPDVRAFGRALAAVEEALGPWTPDEAAASFRPGGPRAGAPGPHLDSTFVVPAVDLPSSVRSRPMRP